MQALVVSHMAAGGRHPIRRSQTSRLG